MLNGAAQAYAREANAADAPADTREMIELGLPIVRRMAFRMARRLPPSVDVNDLISAGTEGLLRAVQSHDRERYPVFEPYAKMRIRGAILDELRAHDNLTRYGRRKASTFAAAAASLRQELGREPTAEETADRLGISLEEFQRFAGEVARRPLLRASEEEPDTVGADDDPLPDGLVIQRELHHNLVKAIAQLPERTQRVLALYYQEECTQSEIGEILGVTESRVCQILSEATKRLRTSLEQKDRAPVRRKPTSPNTETVDGSV